MYSMVAIGFVLIYKASGVFNFAQGVAGLFAALTFVSIVERGAGSGSRSGSPGGDAGAGGAIERAVLARWSTARR
jgi:branched-subunit amino acid ABC-type transport system permease component